MLDYIIERTNKYIGRIPEYDLKAKIMFIF